MPTMATGFTGLCVLWEIRAGGQNFLRILYELYIYIYIII